MEINIPAVMKQEREALLAYGIPACQADVLMRDNELRKYYYECVRMAIRQLAKP